jgi:hypothetical protein
MANKELSNIIRYRIEGIAYFEDRRFVRAISEKYVFLEKVYLVSLFPALEPELTNYSSIIPLNQNDLTDDEVVTMVDLKVLLKNIEYNFLLLDLLSKAQTYDQVNVIFKYIIEQKKFDSRTINSMLELSLKESLIRNAFQARDYLPMIVESNLSLIRSDVLQDFLSKFPKPNNILIYELLASKNKVVGDQKEQYELSLVRISDELRFREESSWK